VNELPLPAAAPRASARRSWIVALLPLLWALVPAGCKQPADLDDRSAATEQSSGQWREELFDVAIDNLQHLEEYDSSAMLQEVANRLGEWLQSQEVPADWKLDPLAAALPQPLSLLPQLREPKRRDFNRFDAEALRGVVWYRDVAGRVVGKKTDPVARAAELFDWTIRNIEVLPAADGAAQPSQLLWETLLWGAGTAADRAWVFLMLARQQGLDAALLGIAPPSPAKEGQLPQPWAVAVLVDGQLYLFDPQRGVPIPGPQGVLRDAHGRLQIRPATLKQVVADPKLLDRMKIDKDDVYPVGPPELQRVVALLDVTPESLTAKMKLIESRLAGDRRMRLSAAPSTQAEQWKTLAHVCGVELWRYPFETTYRWLRATQDEKAEAARRERLHPFLTIADGRLWKARVQQLRGEFTGDNGAIQSYQVVRPSQDVLELAEAKRQQMHYDLARGKVGGVSEQQLQEFSRKQAERETQIMLRAKQDASFWLGLVSYEREAYAAAIDYFARRTLEPWPKGPWTTAARYNLGRAYEANGDDAHAIEAYRRSKDPCARLRATWLEQVPAAKKP